ncbi:MAG TPA: MFS transporter [Candidatus Lokiarchaeia archaeon]|nr:MFS transporter [Candidatus Lokiarchaeia archaeon]
MVETSEESTKPPSKRIVWIYALPRIGSSLLLGIEGFAVLTLYIDGYGLPPLLAGIALAMGYLSIAGSQFLFGWLSDHVYTKLGKRKPFLIVLSPLLCVSFIFLVLPRLILPDLHGTMTLFIWMLVWDVIFRMSYGLTTPYQAWLAELFKTKDRPMVSAYQNITNYLGTAIMAIFSLVILTEKYVLSIAANLNALPLMLTIATIPSAIISAVLFYLTVFFLPTEPRREIKVNFMQSLKTTVRNRNFLLVVLMQGISGFAWSMITPSILKYINNVLQFQTWETVIVAGCLVLGVVTCLFLFRRQIEKKGKKPVLLLIFILGVIFMPLTLLGLIATGHLIIGIILAVAIGAVLGGWYLFPYIIYADIAEDDEKSTGDLRAGIYAGFPSIILNIFQAAGTILLGAILSIPNITVGTATFSEGLVLFGPICSGILLASWLYTRKYVNLDFKWENKQLPSE